MQRLAVRSSNLKVVGYDVSTGILEIEFRNNTIYHYFNVPRSIYNSLMSAASHGEFHAAYIKNRFSYKRIR